MTFRASALYALRIMFSKDNGKNVIGRKSFIGAMICICVSLIPLVAVLVISNGMINGITGRMIGLSTQHLSVYLSRKSPYAKDYDSFCLLSDRLAKIQGIEGVYPEVQGNVLVAGKKSRTGAQIRAVESSIFSKNESFQSLLEVEEGIAEFESLKSAVIGKYISEKLNLHPGDSISVISMNLTDTGKVVPKVTSFTISGVVSCGYQELDALWVFIPLEAGFSAIPSSSSQFMCNLVTKDPFDETLLLKNKINVQNELLGERGSPIKGAYVYSWNEINQSQFENFSSTKSLLILIVILIVLVACVNISSAIIMIVMERRKEIAILKSMGASSHGITVAFLLTGFACGLGGVMTGIPLGLLASVNINRIITFVEKMLNFIVKTSYLVINKGSTSGEIHLLDPAYYLQEIPIVIPFSDLYIIGVMTLLLSLVVSIVPSVKAGKEKPISILKKI